VTLRVRSTASRRARGGVFVAARPIWRRSELSFPRIIPATDHAVTSPSGVPTPLWASAQN